MAHERIHPAEAKRVANARYRDPVWLAKQPHPEVFDTELFRSRRAAEAPLAAALQALGFPIDSAWELYLFGDYDDAMPILVEHLARDYPDRVRQGIAIALNRPSAKPFWSDLVHLYVSAEPSETKDALANVLSSIVTRANMPEYSGLILDEANGSSRVLLIRALKRLRDPEGRALLDKLQTHPELGKEARACLQGRSRSR